MVRLTDLVGTSDRKKKQGSPAGRPISTKRQPAGESKGFLQASDLASIYDIPDQTESPEESQDTLSRDTSQAVPLEESPAVEQAPPQQPPGTDQPIPGETEDSYEQESVGEMPPESPPESGETVPKQPLPGTLAYHQEKGRQKASISDERRFFEEADAIHIELLDLIDDVYTDGRESRVPRVERLIEPLMRLITVCRNSNVILRKAVRLKKGGETLTTHSLNVAILSIKIGISRGYSQEKLFSFALCALLGDIGMTRVDPAILNKKGKLEPEEFQEIKNHVKYSRDIALQISNKFPFLAPIIYQLHERENGNGYPEGLRGGNIHEFAKIIGMCDVFIAMTSPKSHRTDFSGYETLQQIISRRGIDFNAGIIKSLIDVISVFPLESLVKMNNSAIGRVIDISPVHPTRPKLNILVDSDGEHLKTGKILDLEREPLLYIEDPDIEEGAIL